MPSADELDPSRGTIAIERRTGKLELIQSWRGLAAERGLSIRQLVLEVSGGHATFTGTPGQIADTWAHYVRTRAVDGFNITPHLLPSSLTDIVDKVVPELQDRGVYPAEYVGTTLREHLALPAAPPRRGCLKESQLTPSRHWSPVFSRPPVPRRRGHHRPAWHPLRPYLSNL